MVMALIPIRHVCLCIKDAKSARTYRISSNLVSNWSAFYNLISVQCSFPSHIQFHSRWRTTAFNVSILKTSIEYSEENYCPKCALLEVNRWLLLMDMALNLLSIHQFKLVEIDAMEISSKKEKLTFKSNWRIIKVEKRSNRDNAVWFTFLFRKHYGRQLFSVTFPIESKLRLEIGNPFLDSDSKLHFVIRKNWMEICRFSKSVFTFDRTYNCICGEA